jgi:hypothetical protein
MELRYAALSLPIEQCRSGYCVGAIEGSILVTEVIVVAKQVSCMLLHI